MIEDLEVMTLPRVYLPTETLGTILRASGEPVCKTMELPWLNNANSISCIPEGIHRVVFEETSPLHKYPHFRIPDVIGRRGILIHKITYVKDLRGCIGVGSRHVDINKDGVPDMEASGVKLAWMCANLPKEFFINIFKR